MYNNETIINNAFTKDELDSILSEFECVSSTLVGNNTEVDAVYLNKNL